MRQTYAGQLDELTEGLAALARLAAAAVRGATCALVEADADAADEVVAGDAAIDALHHELDSLVLDLLARQQPVASDLRAVVTSLRMSSDLERVGDYAVHLARIARRSALPPSLRGAVAEMGERAAAITAKAGDVVASRDLAAARDLLDDDDAVDRLHAELLQTLLAEPHRFATDEVVDVTLVARHLERLADHAVSVARSVGYIVTGGYAALR